MKKKIVREQFLIMLGALIYSLGVNMFLSPNKISGGGITAIAIVFLHLFGIHLSITNIVINIILFVLGYKFLGKYVVFKNLTGVLYVSMFLELTRNVFGYTSDLLIATMSGGLLVGLGVGLTLKAEGSTGGTDFMGLIINKFFSHIPMAYSILFLDILGVVVAGIVFKSFEVAFYSCLALYIGAKLIDAIITFGDSAKSIRVFSDKNDEIFEFIKRIHERGATGIHCKGMYSNEEKIMLYCIVSPKQLPGIIDFIKRTDKGAFVIISNAKEVIGEGFKLIE